MNEKTNVMQAAAAIEGIKIGPQRFLILPHLVFPAGNNRICSSRFGSSVDRTGSQNRITRAILNQA